MLSGSVSGNTFLEFVCVCVCAYSSCTLVHTKMVSTDDDTSFHPLHVSATEDPETDISCTDVMILLLCLSSIGGFIVFLVWIASPRLFGTPS